MELYNDNYLQHYGVKGQKWGVRRYRNADGSLTKEGKRKAKQEYKADNKKAFELGRNATIYGKAAVKSTNRTIKIENKLNKQYAKDPSGSSKKTQKLHKQWTASAKTTAELLSTYNKHRDTAKKHCDSLIKKYGKEAVTDIKYTDTKLRKGEYSPKTMKVMNEKTSKLSDYAKSGLATLGGAAMATLLGSPTAIYFTPTSDRRYASEVESEAYYRNLRN